MALTDEQKTAACDAFGVWFYDSLHPQDLSPRAAWLAAAERIQEKLNQEEHSRLFLQEENAKLREQLANREKYYEEYIRLWLNGCKQLKTDAGL